MEKKAIIYIRVSDPSQIENNSLETQESICLKFAKNNSYNVIKIFREEGRSAKDLAGRPELKKLIMFCKEHKGDITAVLVYKLDRFSRNLSSALEIEAILSSYGTDLVSATENYEKSPLGTALKNIVHIVNQLDNENKGERVRENMQASFKKGLWPFKCPIGYKRKYDSKEKNKGLAPIQDKYLAPIVKRLFEDASKGVYSKSQLAKIMNLNGFSKYYGKKATHKTVNKILSKTFYYGEMYAKKWGIYHQGNHIPIIDKNTWNLAYQRTVLKTKKFSLQDSDMYPLKGLIRCNVCKEIMTTCPSRGNKKIYYYECKNKKNCRKTRINSRDAHIEFEKILRNVQPSSRVIKLFNHMVFSEWDKAVNQVKNDREKLEETIEEKRNDIRKIIKAKEEGLLTLDEAREEIQEIREKIALLKIDATDMEIEEYNAEMVKNFTDKFLSNIFNFWSSLDLGNKQTLQSKIFSEGIYCTLDKRIRTNKLSPAFELINTVAKEDGLNVPPRGVEPRFLG